MTRPTGFATRAIHHAYNPLENDGALTPPLHLTSTFSFETAEAGGEMFAGEREGHIYSRISNPTCDLLERRIAVLEGAEAGLALSSGMGAITAVMWTLLSPGDEVIVDKTLYGCTFAFMRHGLAKWGVTISHVDMTDPENLRAAVSEKPAWSISKPRQIRTCGWWISQPALKSHARSVHRSLSTTPMRAPI